MLNNNINNDNNAIKYNSLIVEKSGMNPIAVNITKSIKFNGIKFYLMTFTKDTRREIDEGSCQVMRSYLKRPHKFLHLYTEYTVFSWRSYFGRLWRLGGSKSLGRGVEV